MFIKMTLNKIWSIINTLVSLDKHDSFKKSCFGCSMEKNPPSIEKYNGFSTQSCLKMFITLHSKIFCQLQNFKW